MIKVNIVVIRSNCTQNTIKIQIDYEVNFFNFEHILYLFVHTKNLSCLRVKAVLGC